MHMQINSHERKSFDVYLTNVPFSTIELMAEAMESYLELVDGEIPTEYMAIKKYLKHLVTP